MNQRDRQPGGEDDARDAGYILAMVLLQSELWHKLADDEKAAVDFFLPKSLCARTTYANRAMWQARKERHRRAEIERMGQQSSKDGDGNV